MKVTDQIIFSNTNRNLEITVSNNPCKGYSKFLDEIIWGSNGPQFSYLGTNNKLQHLDESLFFTCWVDNQIAALFTTCKRSSPEQTISYYYGRHFAVSSNQKHKGLGAFLVKTAFNFFKLKCDFPAVFYAFIEKDNINSINVVKKFNLITANDFSTYVFNHVFPKSNQVKQISFKEFKNYIPKFPKQDYSFYYSVINRGDFWLLKNNSNDPLAIVQTFDQHWVLRSYPNRFLNILIKLFSKSTLLSRVISSDFKHLTVDQVFYNNSIDLEHLLEGILYHKKLNHIMIHSSKDISNIKMGLLHKISGTTNSNLIYTGFNLSEDQELFLQKNKPFISGFDIG